MSTYFLLVNYTQQGIENIKDAPHRAEAAKGLAKECGAELKETYLTMGAYDIVGIVEASSDDAVTRFALALCSLGNVRTTTLRAFTEQEFRGIIGSLP